MKGTPMPKLPAIPLKVLVVDDDPGDFFLFEEMVGIGVTDAVVSLEHAGTFADGLERLNAREHDLCFMDYRLGKRTGIELLAAATQEAREIPVVMFTGQGDEDIATEALRAGATDYIRKESLTPEILDGAFKRTLRLLEKERQRREATEALRRERDFVNAILENSHDGIAVVNPCGAVPVYSPGMESIFGYAKEDVPDVATWARRILVREEDQRRFVSLFERARKRLDMGEAYFSCVARDGRVRSVRFQAALMPGDDVVVNGQDVTRLRQVEIQLAAANARLEEQNEVLRMQASTDLLTGLSNRRALLSDAKQHWNRALRLDEEFSVVLLDIDNFKRVNDQRGHLVGDEVLERIGRILWDAKRSYDEAGRWGGEEFMLVLPAAGIDQAHAAAERIRQAISQERFFDRDEQAFSVTASLGVASRDEATRCPEELFHQADEALYQAKRSGKNRTCLARPRHANGHPPLR